MWLVYTIQGDALTFFGLFHDQRNADEAAARIAGARIARVTLRDKASREVLTPLIACGHFNRLSTGGRGANVKRAGAMPRPSMIWSMVVLLNGKIFVHRRVTISVLVRPLEIAARFPHPISVVEDFPECVDPLR